MTAGSVKAPTPEQLKTVAADLGMTFSAPDLEMHHAAMLSAFDAYNVLDQMTDEIPEVFYPRTPGKRPAPEENKHGAWYVKTTIKGSGEGKLAGKTVALKDNICLAGVPMMNGASSLEGYIPDIDATVVTKILDAGATILGKAVSEYLCFSNDSHTSATGPVHNPHRMGYSAGGSSSGSACLVALGEVDMALGADQGGSIRIPAAACGIYGMKPTHGLVPYTGIMPIETTLDHVGPMTATVADNALLLEVLAGPDGLDPRQYGHKAMPYCEALNLGVAGLRIAVVAEGFGHLHSMPEVDACVRSAAERFRALGATVDTISIPMHLDSGPIWLAVAAEGSVMQMMHGNGFGFNWQGLYVTSLLNRHAAWRQQADSFSETLKNTMMLGHFMVKHYRGHYYAKAQNLVRRLRASYDKALEQYDLLLMPTTPITATKLPPENVTIDDMLQRSFKVGPNVTPFDCTHHPAMSVPCGMVDGLPVGLMLVGRMLEESTIYQAAAALERELDWRSV